MIHIFLMALKFPLSPVMAGHLLFKLSRLGVRTPPKILSCLPNAYICFEAVAQNSSRVSPEWPTAWHGTSQGTCCSSRWGGKTLLEHQLASLGILAQRVFSLGTQACSEGHFSCGSAAPHQHRGSTLLVLQITAFGALKPMYLCMYVYMHECIRSQTKHYKCAVKK